MGVAPSFGAGTFGGAGPLLGHWGRSDSQEARRLVDLCLEAGVNLFDAADVCFNDASGRVLGEATKLRRGAPLPAGSRLHETAAFGPPVEEEQLLRVVEALDAVAEETCRSLPQRARPDAASAVTAPYSSFPYRRQAAFARLNPPAV
ncbi:hypothetical protein E0493_14885 [Roseomonas sp. M0104]|uniref:NADP-dependent oxidoreductase domain-containing protein n=1 Tax=Teichococcus coralli TaxID=2545983 RepID=A0A845BEU6_9PROT|nr:hypothetical protein [Pseudoroseomonas coralli]